MTNYKYFNFPNYDDIIYIINTQSPSYLYAKSDRYSKLETSIRVMGIDDFYTLADSIAEEDDRFDDDIEDINKLLVKKFKEVVDEWWSNQSIDNLKERWDYLKKNNCDQEGFDRISRLYFLQLDDKYKLAILLHNKLCNWNHQDQCAFYMHKDRFAYNWTCSTYDSWIRKAEDALAEVSEQYGRDKAYEMIETTLRAIK